MLFRILLLILVYTKKYLNREDISRNIVECTVAHCELYQHNYLYVICDQSAPNRRAIDYVRKELKEHPLQWPIIPQISL